MSKHVSPHVTSFVEADVTNLVLWRERVKKEFEKKEGEKEPRDASYEEKKDDQETDNK